MDVGLLSVQTDRKDGQLPQEIHKTINHLKLHFGDLKKKTSKAAGKKNDCVFKVDVYLFSKHLILFFFCT